MKKRIYLYLFPIIFSLSLTSCYKDPGEVSFEVSDIEDNYEIHSDLQIGLLKDEDPNHYCVYYNDILGVSSLSEPNKIDLEYSLKSDNGSEAKSVHVLVSKNQDMSNPMVFEGKDNHALIYNFEINTTYYYQLQATYISNFKSEIKSFYVKSDAPRNLYVEGVENVRDLGGWNIGEGKIYKQGLIYRTAQFNHGDSKNKYNDYVSAPTELGLKVLREDLKIKTDIDLRKNKEVFNYDEVVGISSSPLGDDINYVSAPMQYGGKNVIALPENKESLEKFFNTLADESNYPIAFHCLRGTDRTGALAYVLGALVGMSQEDLYLDYLFSNFGKIGSLVYTSSIAGLYVRGIEQSEGETYSLKTRNYLKSYIDISDETIDRIIDILTD